MKLLLNKEKKKLYPNKLTNDINTNEGIIKKTDYNNKKNKLTTHKGHSFLKIKPNFNDLFKNIKRRAQIITLKDGMFIAGNLGLSQGSKILDCGGGSGATSLIFANIVGNKGKIVTVEKEKRFAKIIEENIKMFKFKNIKLINKNLLNYKTKTRFDAVNLDLPSPWEAIEKIDSILINGGMLSVYVPNTTQLTIMQNKMKQTNFLLKSVNELILRNWKVKGKICHPKFKILGHTGFIMIYRKVKI